MELEDDDAAVPALCNKKCNHCNELKPTTAFKHMKVYGVGEPDEPERDRRYNNICSVCYPEMKEMYRAKLENGKAAKKAAVAGAQAAAAAGGSGSGGSSSAKNKISPAFILEQSAANALKSVNKTISQAREAYRGVPPRVGVAVVVWDENATERV